MIFFSIISKPYCSRKRLFLALLGIVIAALSSKAQAETVSWSATGTGDWFTENNWSTKAIPTSAGDVTLGKANAVTTIATGAATQVQSLKIDGKVTVIGGGPATLKITNGSLTIATGLTLGSTNSGLQYDKGIMEITGASSSVSGASLIVGASGKGEITISDGGKASFDTVVLGSNSGNGQITVKGTEGNRGVLEAGSIAQGISASGNTRLYIDGGILRAKGNESDFLRNFTAGYLNFQAGGVFIDTNGFNVGITNSVLLYGIGGFTKIGEGTLTLTGTGNYNGGTVVKQGTLTVSSGGNLYSDYSSAIVGSTAGDNATLRIEAGGKLQEDATIIGHAAGAIGSVTVTGKGSLLNSRYTNGTVGALTVGHSGRGILNLSNGGKSQSRMVTVGLEDGSEGEIIISGAQDGTASLLDVGVETTSSVTIGQRGSGTLTIEEGGIARIRNGAGTLFIGTEAGSRGVLNVGGYDLGHATQAGTLEAKAVVFGSGSGAIYFNQTNTTTFSASVSGDGSIVQRGAGTTILTGTNTQTGGTFVQAGTLIVKDSHLAAITVEGGILNGSGVLGAISLKNGRFSLGTSAVAHVRASSLEWGDGVMVFDLGLNAATSDFLTLDKLTATGDQLLFSFVNNGWVVGKTYDLLSFESGAVNLELFGYTNANGFDGRFLLEGNTLKFTLDAIPESSTCVLGSIAGAIITIALRRRRACRA